MKLTYKFLRGYKKQSTNRQRGGSFIPISSWIEELKKSEGPLTCTINNEEIGIRVGEGPQVQGISKIIAKMRNGTVPGTDQISPKLYKAKAAPLEFITQITNVMREVWNNNIVPDDWLITKQVPIPKKACPRSIADYRRISICNVGYRIYANYLLERLDAEIESLGSYQVAFLQNRSTDDHIFTYEEC